MFENTIYSVISPESCAAIIYRDSSHAPAAAQALKMTAQDLEQVGLIDGIIPEPGEGAQDDLAAAAEIPAIHARDRLGRANGTEPERIDRSALR